MDLAPLQPLASNGREQRSRLISHGSASIGPVLPTAASLQSLSPLNTISTTVTAEPTLNTAMETDEEKEKLKTDLEQLKSELQKSKEIIAKLQKSEEQMRER